ncbi:MAG: 2-phospho-L-lactate guanylyltransferase [Acidimicrobiia bacterium]|nr:2-phospho-L-lactate guanylyltransferase [Acidimicrobiia bacterium]
MVKELPLVGIPLKPFGVAKQRLDSRLTASQRSTLGKAVAAHTIAITAEAVCEVVVVTGDPGVAAWGARLGVDSIEEGIPGTGLNGAAASLRDSALQSGRPWLVLHADLPSLSSADVAALLAALARGPVASPSYDGGTTALGASERAGFSYGPGSFHRHLRQLPTATVVIRPGLAFDLDTVADLEAAAKANAWVRAALDSPE